MELESSKTNYLNLEDQLGYLIFKNNFVTFLRRKEPLSIRSNESNVEISSKSLWSPIIWGYKNVANYAKAKKYNLAVIKRIYSYGLHAEFTCDFYRLGSNN